jgi:hypothetical protein
VQEPLPARSPQAATQTDGSQARDDEALAEARIEAVSTSSVVVSADATGLDLQSTGNLADEIARLQALIRELTQPIEWHIPDGKQRGRAQSCHSTTSETDSRY